MSAVRNYLFRLVCAAAMSSAVLSLPLQKQLKRLLGLACGCILVLLTLTPLCNLDLPTLLRSLPPLIQEDAPFSDTQNDALLQKLICEQTAAVIEEKAEELGITVRAEVTVKYDETIGSFLPYRVTVTVLGGEGSKEALRRFVTEELAIAEERQIWILN